jgi:hypothetical protein
MCGTEGESGVIMATCGMGEVVRAIGRVGELLGGEVCQPAYATQVVRLPGGVVRPLEEAVGSSVVQRLDRLEARLDYQPLQ